MHHGRARRILGAAPLVALVAALSGGGADAGCGSAPQPVLIKTTVPLTADVVSALSAHTTHVSYIWPQIRGFAATVDQCGIDALRSDPRVARVEIDGEVSMPDVAAQALWEAVAGASAGALDTVATMPLQTWNLDLADTAGSGFDGTGVMVAVVDSGLPQNWEQFLPAGSVDLTHAAGFGPMGRGTEANAVHAVEGVGGHLGLLPHGLAVSCIITGFPSEFGPVGGAAPGARILPIRTVGRSNLGLWSWTTAAFLYVADLKASGAIPGPLVINYSAGGSISGASIVADAIDYAIAQGVLFVTVAHNNGPAADSIAFPGSLPQAITVGMVGWKGEGASGPGWFFDDVPENDVSQVYVPGTSGRESDPPAAPSRIDVMGPGVFVFGEALEARGYSEGRQSAFDGVAHFPIIGTSFAAPHVTGIVAQMLQKNPALTQAEAESILRATALPIPADPDGVITAFFLPMTPIGIPGSVFWGPWGANATGSGLARGTAAVAATPQ